MCASTQTAQKAHHILLALKAYLQVAENRLIELLPPKARRRLLALCRPAALTMADTLCEPGAHLLCNGPGGLLSTARSGTIVR